jgi:DNA-binding transcriptional ArsR family regulator
MLSMQQPAVSQQLARLRADRLVKARRDGKAIYYSIASPELYRIIRLLYDVYCAHDDGAD